MNVRQISVPAALVAALVAFSPAYAAENADPTGVWINDTGRGAVEIKPCGADLCGHVVWVKDESDASGCGRQIIGEVKPAGRGTWDNGWIYSPERKKRYSVELTPLDRDRLKVKGYAGTKFFSKTMVWTRAPDDLARCDATHADAKPAGSAQEPSVAPQGSDSTTVTAAADAAVPAEKETREAPATAAPVPEVPAEPGEQAATEDESRDVAEIGDVLGQFLKKGPNGTCKLDLPWVKVDFTCEK